MRKKMKKTTKQYIIVAIICIIVIGGAAAFTTYVMLDVAKDKYNAMIEDANAKINESERTVYIANEDISPGELVTQEKVTKKTILANYPQEYFMTSDDFGKVSLISIKSGTGILSTMLSEQEIDVGIREIEYDVININTNINNQDTIDVRIMFPNGENYIVLSKKIIRNYNPEQPNCFLWLNEEEILRMSAAIVDAGLYPGTRLYVTKYVEPAIQEASKVTYTPSLSVLSLLETDPNILERSSQALAKDVRKALENRLARNMEMDVSETAWDIPDNTFYNGNDITDDTPNDILDDDELIDDPEYPIIETGKIEEDYLYYAEEKEHKEEVLEFGD